jgi:hypothetical protein
MNSVYFEAFLVVSLAMISNFYQIIFLTLTKLNQKSNQIIFYLISLWPAISATASVPAAALSTGERSAT